MRLQKNALGVRAFGALVGAVGRLARLTEKLIPPPFRLLQVGSAFWQSRALYVVARLDVATVLQDQQLAVEEIAGRVGADPGMTARLLRLLASLGIFKEIRPGVFANNQVSRHLRGDIADSVRAMVLMHNGEAMSRPWHEQLENGVRSGQVPFQLAHGRHLYDYMEAHPSFDKLFAEAMESVERLGGDEFAADFDWGRFERVIDLGGGIGSKSVAILKRHEHLRALVVDRPQVVREAPDYWRGRAEAGLLRRLSFQGGDLFDAPPAARSGRDIYLLSAVCHGLDDEGCAKLLRSLAASCAASGVRMAVLEMVRDEATPDAAAAAVDVQLLMGTPGRLRSLAEWRALCGRCGLRLQERVRLRSLASILVLEAAPGVYQPGC